MLQLNEYPGVPPEVVMSIAPLFPPKQEILEVETVILIGFKGWLIVNVSVIVQPEISDTLTI